MLDILRITHRAERTGANRFARRRVRHPRRLAPLADLYAFGKEKIMNFRGVQFEFSGVLEHSRNIFTGGLHGGCDLRLNSVNPSGSGRHTSCFCVWCERQRLTRHQFGFDSR